METCGSFDGDMIVASPSCFVWSAAQAFRKSAQALAQAFST